MPGLWLRDWGVGLGASDFGFERGGGGGRSLGSGLPCKPHLTVGMFALIPTVLNEDSSRGLGFRV